MTTWLMKSEPTEYSIDDLEKDGSSSWFGIRNYQARNSMRDSMKIGDRVLFYHSNCKVPGIVGIACVCSGSHPDLSQFDPDGDYFDPKSTIEKPIWYCVDVEFVSKLSKIISLYDIKSIPELSSMKILQKGNRLSITLVSEDEYSLLQKFFTL